MDPPCVVIPRSASPLGYEYEVVNNIVWYSGCYNPNNAEEAAVVLDAVDPALSGNGHGLYRLNLRTGQRTLLFDGVASRTVDWSRSGWILFGRGGEGWKIKANGDSATQFTATNRTLNIAEAWSLDGRLALFRRDAPTYAQTGLAIYTAKGDFVRLLPDASTRAAVGVGWSPDGRRLAYIGGPGSPVNEPRLCIYDLTTNQRDTLDVVPKGNYSATSGVQWLPSGNELVWDARPGIYITNVQTRRMRLVRASCVITTSGAMISRGIAYARPSPDGQQLLVGRGDFALSPTNSNLLLRKHSLETMNLQGGQLRKITP